MQSHCFKKGMRHTGGINTTASPLTPTVRLFRLARRYVGDFNGQRGKLMSGTGRIRAVSFQREGGESVRLRVNRCSGVVLCVREVD